MCMTVIACVSRIYMHLLGAACMHTCILRGWLVAYYTVWGGLFNESALCSAFDATCICPNVLTEMC